MVDWRRFGAVLFDLDGVLTATALLHARCWKETFDPYLAGIVSGDEMASRPFDALDDYEKYVSGKPRHDGVTSFLASRGLCLPEGVPTDSRDTETICGLGNRKAECFSSVLLTEGVEAYPDAVALVRYLHEQSVRMAVVSSSRNCGPILDATEISNCFELRVDGVVAERVGLAGKPAPDTFVHAAHELGVAPQETAVVEDAIAGVRAAKAGSFSLVVGINRTAGQVDLVAAGADVVVRDLRETYRQTAGPMSSVSEINR